MQPRPTFEAAQPTPDRIDDTSRRRGGPDPDRPALPGQAARSTPSRRAWLGWLGTTLALAGCAMPGRRTPGSATPDRLIDLASGRTLTEVDRSATLRSADFVLLGEQHDNALHHAGRGELIAQLGRRGSVVAEHLERGRRLAPPASSLTADLLGALQAAGFEPRGWQWPLHEGLFAPLVAAGVAVQGGNLPRELARRIAREGESALPADLAELLRAAPLPPAAQAQLDEALLGSHCGQLPANRLPGLRAAQRARDAAMAQALLQAAEAMPSRPVWLVAGNAHVRRDYGVGQLLAVLHPQARVLSVALLDGEVSAADLPSPEAHTLAWITAAPDRRDDPCG